MSAPRTGTSRQVATGNRRSMDLLTKVFAVLLAVLALVAVAQRWLPYGLAEQVGYTSRLAGPGPGWGVLGADQLGRAMLPRLLGGTAVTLSIAIPSALAAAAVASVAACFAVSVGGWLDEVSNRLVDVLFTFPSILLALLMVSIVGPGTWGAVVAIVLIVSPQVFRIVRSRAREVAPREFVLSSRVAGASHPRVVFVHLLPNVAGSVVVQTAFALIVAMLVESSLSFLGLGVTPPTASLGSLIHDGYPYLTSRPWLTFEPATLLALIIFSINVVSDWVRDRLDVRTTVALP